MQVFTTDQNQQNFYYTTSSFFSLFYLASCQTCTGHHALATLPVSTKSMRIAFS